ncbi:hypothetical protein MYSTI_07770 [Myxococcus stipitatus DSM 14675]|uniref:Uncharacterized protein n=1 Tax=Myxococcus stipitatus (strain DSM 14675 / JCM 12634 / Mx s8) TaxID=1278073 RepID=L7UN89_MYXSD|nr:hypothetical protein [Myxococcus stipitatus]AGC49042.1 hypothetical protein MYSTI_07770 [Myxococcus stipitatus DSM 14675]
MVASRGQGLTKNVFGVALCLLVGGGVAFALRESKAPRPLPPGPVEPAGGVGGAQGGPVDFDGGTQVSAGARVGPTDEAEPPSLGRQADSAFCDEVVPPMPHRMSWGGPRTDVKVWCEGLSVERCGKYPKSCEVGIYCDGVRFCRSQSEHPSQEPCAGEGVQGASVACCPGLVARCGVPLASETCSPQTEDESEPVCLRCGDGVCGPLEQACNCPEDCAPSEARPKLRYRGWWPEGAWSKKGVAPDLTATPGQCLDARSSPEGIHRCMVSWSAGLFGLRRAAELRRVENLELFTPFDVDLMACLERASSYAHRLSETSREGCLEALYQRTQDSRLGKVRWYSLTYKGGG